MCKHDYISIKPFEIVIGILLVCWGFWLWIASSTSFVYVGMFKVLSRECWGGFLFSLGALEIYASIRNVFFLRRTVVFLILILFAMLAVFLFSSPNSHESFTPFVTVWLVAYCGMVYVMLGGRNGR